MGAPGAHQPDPRILVASRRVPFLPKELLRLVSVGSDVSLLQARQPANICFVDTWQCGLVVVVAPIAERDPKLMIIYLTKVK